MILQGWQQGPGQYYLIGCPGTSEFDFWYTFSGEGSYFLYSWYQHSEEKEVNLQAWENETLQACFEQS